MNNLPMPSAPTIGNYFTFLFHNLFSDSKTLAKFIISYCLLISCFLVKYIQEHKKKIIEGELRCDELKVYLEKIGAPKIVWLSEDGSGVIQRAVYDVSSNQLVGLVLPIDKSTGMPISMTFVTRSLKDIENHMTAPLSKLIYVVIAQPIMENCPPFVLQLFGTDNKFTRFDVGNRWTHTIAELRK